MSKVQAADAALQAADSLDALLAEIECIDEDIIDRCDLPGLPNFGGEEPKNTDGIWSWDETRFLVTDWKRGTGFVIVDRSAW